MKILILRFSAIGDLLLITGLLRMLRLQLGAELHLLVKKNYAGVLSTNAHLGAIHSWEDAQAKPILAALRQERFDLLLDLQHNLRSYRITWALGLPSTRLNKLNWRKYLFTRFKINILPPALHVFQRYLHTAEHLGIADDGLGLEYPLLPEAQIDSEALWGWASGSYTALAFGAAHATKALPYEKLKELCLVLAPHRLLLVGGKAETALAEKVLSDLGEPEHLRHACGQFSLQESAWALQKAKAVVAVDTGLMHLGAALQKPIYLIWGNTHPSFGMGAYYGSASGQRAEYLEMRELACRPCSKIGHKSCPKKHFLCMLGQDFAPIRAWLDSFANSITEA